MTTLRRFTALVLLALLLVLPTAAASVEAEGHGWWWRPQSGLLGVDVPPPPDVPEDGLLVERAPDGLTALSALRFRLDEGEADPVLTLTVASDQGGAAAAIAACPTTVRWTPDQAGRWDVAPSYDCERGQVDGVRSEDGATWTWDLDSLVSDAGVLDFALVDGSETPFHVAFEAPTASSLSTTVAPPPPPPAPDPPPPPPASQEGQQQPPAESSDPPAFVPPPMRTETGPPPGQTTAPPAPEVAGPGTAEQPVVQPAAQPVATPAAPAQGLSPLAAGLMGMIGALLLTDLLAIGGQGGGSRPWRRPRETTGGIGRFARDRTEGPAALW